MSALWPLCFFLPKGHREKATDDRRACLRSNQEYGSKSKERHFGRLQNGTRAKQGGGSGERVDTSSKSRSSVLRLGSKHFNVGAVKDRSHTLRSLQRKCKLILALISNFLPGFNFNLWNYSIFQCAWGTHAFPCYGEWHIFVASDSSIVCSKVRLNLLPNLQTTTENWKKSNLITSPINAHNIKIIERQTGAVLINRATHQVTFIVSEFNWVAVDANQNKFGMKQIV